MDLDIVARLDQLVPNPSCVYEALESILSSCETPENTMERSWLSVRLSLCEFAAAHVDYPSVCFDQSQLATCTRQLESRSTWWTTYSGNYRHISVICHEYQPQFESRKIIGVLRNATDLFGSLERNYRETLTNAETTVAFVMSQWRELRSNLTLEVANSKLKMNEVENSLSMGKSYIEELLANMGGTLMSTVEQLHTSLELSMQTKEQSDIIQTNFNNFEKAMKEILVQNYVAADLLRKSVNETTIVLDATKEALKESNTIINLVLAFIQIFVGIASKLWIFVLLFILGIVLYRLNCGRKRIYSSFESKQEELDPIFY